LILGKEMKKVYGIKNTGAENYLLPVIHTRVGIQMTPGKEV
jgi:hypothetical protein